MVPSPFPCLVYQTYVLFLHCGSILSINTLQGILEKSNIKKLLTSHNHMGQISYLQHIQDYYWCLKSLATINQNKQYIVVWLKCTECINKLTLNQRFQKFGRSGQNTSVSKKFFSVALIKGWVLNIRSHCLLENLVWQLDNLQRQPHKPLKSKGKTRARPANEEGKYVCT